MERSGLADTVYASVKARILLGQARPGEVIAAHALARDLSVSRTPVHEALKRLVGEGYLTIQPRVGYTVTAINLDEMRDLFQVRTRLEALAAELAAQAWSEDLLAAFVAADRTIQDEHQDLMREGSALHLAQFAHEAHKDFHRMIADAGGNHRLGRLIAELQDESQRFWSLMPGDRLVGRVFLADPGHRAILDALATADPVKARAAVVEHMREGVRAMLEAVVPGRPPADELGI